MMTTMNLKLPDPRRFFKWMLLICALSVLLLAIVCAIPTPLQAHAEGFSETAAQEETEDGEPPAQLLDGSAARRLCGAACRLDVDQALDLLLEQRRAAWAGQEEAAIRRMTRTYLEGCRA